jgi:peptidyl-prolyl cis-trans isomerase D
MSSANFIQSLSYLPNKAVLDNYHMTEDKISLKYAHFNDLNYIMGLSPTKDELTLYYDEFKENFRKPAEIKISYLEVKPSDFSDKVIISPDELKDLYDDSLSELTTPEQAEVSHILFRFPSFSPTPEERANVLAQAEAALLRTKTEEFETLAKELSQDTVSREKNGDLGTLSPNQMYKGFDEAVFSASDKINQVLGPVETLFGYHLIKVRSLTPAKTKTLEEASSELEQKLIERKSRRLAIDEIENILGSINKNETLLDVAKRYNIELTESDFFYNSENAPDFLSENQPALEKTLNLSVGSISDPVESPDSFVLYSVLEKKDSFIPSLEEEDIQQKATDGWVSQVANQKAKAAATDFIKLAKEKNWEEAKKSQNKFFIDKTTELFSLNNIGEIDPVIATADPQKLILSLLSFAQIGQIASEPIPTAISNNGYLVLSLSDLKPTEIDNSSEELDKLRSTAFEEMIRSAYIYWNAAAGEKVAIKLPTRIINILNQTEQY